MTDIIITAEDYKTILRKLSDWENIASKQAREIDRLHTELIKADRTALDAIEQNGLLRVEIARMREGISVLDKCINGCENGENEVVSK